MSDKPRYFVPLNEQTQLQTPTSLSGQSRDDSGAAPFTLRKARIRGLPTLLRVAGLLFVIGLGVETYTSLRTLFAWHWLAGGAACVLLLLLCGSALLSLWCYRRAHRDLNQLQRMQQMAASATASVSLKGAQAYQSKLQQLYQHKPQENLLRAAQQQLEDYHSGKEQLALLEQHFIATLDQQAIGVIRKYSQRNAVMVAVSPLALADMLLTLANTAKMISAIAQIYGIRPSRFNQWQLIKQIAAQLAFAGVTEMAVDLVGQFTSQSLLSSLSSRAAQGVGVGLYTVRIGTRAIEACRPMPLTQQQLPALNNLINEFDQLIAVRLKTSQSAQPK